MTPYLKLKRGDIVKKIVQSSEDTKMVPFLVLHGVSGFPRNYYVGIILNPNDKNPYDVICVKEDNPWTVINSISSEEVDLIEAKVDKGEDKKELFKQLIKGQ